MKPAVIFKSFVHALATALYTVGIALFLPKGETWFGNAPPALGVATMLMLLVLSASVTGSLVFAKPVLLFLDGQKKLALQFLVWTLAWLLTIIVLTLMMVRIV